MKVTKNSKRKISFELETGLVAVVETKNGDLFIEGTKHGIPGDADDAMIWEFCSRILSKIDSVQLGCPFLWISDIYQELKPILNLAEEEVPPVIEYPESFDPNANQGS